MTLAQLRYVITVSQVGTLSEAAKRLYISQPSLTNAIKELEKELGITIFIRTNKGVILSRQGEEFLGYARQVIEQTNLIEEKYLQDHNVKHEFCISTQHYSFAVEAFVSLIKEYGGFSALLYWIKKVFKGRKGGLLGMGLLVGLMDIATANNTVAIVMANPIAKEMSKDYGISSRKAASILDTFSCIFQGILPYGAQMLVAVSAAASLGEVVSAFDILPMLLYPYMLLFSSLIFIFFRKDRECLNADVQKEIG